MARNLTEAARWDVVTTPEPADDVSATVAVAGDMQEALQDLTDRDRFLLNYGAGWSRPALIVCADGINISVDGCASLEATYQIAAPVSVAVAGLTPRTWYYLYAAPGTPMVLEYSTSAPVKALRTKFNDETKRYLGAFRTDGAGDVIPFGMCRGRYVYDTEQALLTGSATTFTATSTLPDLVPPTATLVWVRAACQNAGTGLETLYIRTTGSGTLTGHSLLVSGQLLTNVASPTAVNGRAHGLFPLRMSSARTLDYKVTSSQVGAALSVVGFDE